MTTPNDNAQNRRTRISISDPEGLEPFRDWDAYEPERFEVAPSDVVKSERFKRLVEEANTVTRSAERGDIEALRELARSREAEGLIINVDRDGGESGESERVSLAEYFRDEVIPEHEERVDAAEKLRAAIAAQRKAAKERQREAERARSRQRERNSKLAEELGLDSDASVAEINQAITERNSELAVELGLPSDATVGEIQEAIAGQNTTVAVKLGLPPDATAEEINRAITERNSELAVELGLSPQATVGEIQAAVTQQNSAIAVDLGLAPTASVAEINTAIAQRNRERAIELGLDPNSTPEQVKAEIDRRNSAIAVDLGLAPTASVAEINTAIAQRNRERAIELGLDPNSTPEQVKAEIDRRNSAIAVDLGLAPTASVADINTAIAQRNRERAIELGLDPNSTPEQVKAEIDRRNSAIAVDLGLAPTASVADINTAIAQRNRERAIELGLDPGATPEQVKAEIDRRNSELAVDLGLAPTASVADINTAIAQRNRERAIELGLDPNSTPEQVKAEIDRRNSELAVDLGLAPTASVAEINTAIAQRNRERAIELGLDPNSTPEQVKAEIDRRNSELAVDLGLAPTASVAEINTAIAQRNRERAIELGLDPNSTPEQVKAEIDRRNSELAVDLGLAPTASVAEINTAIAQRNRERAIELGLDPGATPEQVKAEIDRRNSELAVDLGLDENATVEQINAEIGRRRRATALELGLGWDASHEEIDAEIKKRNSELAVSLGLAPTASVAVINTELKRLNDGGKPRESATFHLASEEDVSAAGLPAGTKIPADELQHFTRQTTYGDWVVDETQEENDDGTKDRKLVLWDAERRYRVFRELAKVQEDVGARQSGSQLNRILDALDTNPATGEIDVDLDEVQKRYGLSEDAMALLRRRYRSRKRKEDRGERDRIYGNDPRFVSDGQGGYSRDIRPGTVLTAEQAARYGASNLEGRVVTSVTADGINTVAAPVDSVPAPVNSVPAPVNSDRQALLAQADALGIGYHPERPDFAKVHAEVTARVNEQNREFVNFYLPDTVAEGQAPTQEQFAQAEMMAREATLNDRQALLAQADALGIGYHPERPDFAKLSADITVKANEQNREFVNFYLPGTVAEGQAPTQTQIDAAQVVANDIGALDRVNVSQARNVANMNARQLREYDAQLLQSARIAGIEPEGGITDANRSLISTAVQNATQGDLLRTARELGVNYNVANPNYQQVATDIRNVLQTIALDAQMEGTTPYYEGPKTTGLQKAAVDRAFVESVFGPVEGPITQDLLNQAQAAAPQASRADQTAQRLGYLRAIGATIDADRAADAAELRDNRIAALESTFRGDVAGTWGALYGDVGLPLNHPNYAEYNLLRTDRDGPHWRREQRAMQAEEGREQFSIGTINIGPAWDAGRSIISGRHISNYDSDVPFEINLLDFTPVLGTLTDTAIRGRDGYSRGDLAWIAGGAALDILPLPGPGQLARGGRAGLIVARNPRPALQIATGGRRTIQALTQGTLKAPYQVPGTRAKPQGVANIPVRLGDDVIIDGRSMPAWEGLLYQRDKALAQYRLTGEPQTVQIPTADGGLQSVVVGGSRAVTSYGTGGLAHTTPKAGLLTTLSQTDEGLVGIRKVGRTGQELPEIEQRHFMTTQGIPAFLEGSAFIKNQVADPDFSPGFQVLTDPRNLANVENVRKVFGGDVESGVMGPRAVVELEAGIPQGRVIAGGADKPALYKERPVGLQKVAGETLYMHVDVAPPAQAGRLPVLRDNVLAAIDNARGRTDAFYVTRTNADGTTEVFRKADLDALSSQGVAPEDALRIRTTAGGTRLISRAEWRRAASRATRGETNRDGQQPASATSFRPEGLARMGTDRVLQRGDNGRSSRLDGRSATFAGIDSALATTGRVNDSTAGRPVDPATRSPVAPGTYQSSPAAWVRESLASAELRRRAIDPETVPAEVLARYQPSAGRWSEADEALIRQLSRNRSMASAGGLPVPGRGARPEHRLPVPGTGIVGKGLPVPGSGVRPEDRLPVPGTGIVGKGLPVPGSGVRPEDRLPVPGTGIVGKGLPVPGSGVRPEDRLPVPGTGIVGKGLPVPGSGVRPEDRLPVPGTGITGKGLPVPGSGITSEGLSVPGTGITGPITLRPWIAARVPERTLPAAIKRPPPKPDDSSSSSGKPKRITKDRLYPDLITWETRVAHTYDPQTNVHHTRRLSDVDLDTLRVIGSGRKPISDQARVALLDFIIDHDGVIAEALLERTVTLGQRGALPGQREVSSQRRRPPAPRRPPRSPKPTVYDTTPPVMKL